MLPIILLVIILMIFIFYYPESRGVVFFDIDYTLSDMPECDQETIIQHCLDRGYDIGIITASDRPIHYLVHCYGTANKELSPWMSNTMAKYLHTTNFRTYNTMSLTTGIELPFPNFPYPSIRMYGWKKGWQMKVAIDKFGYDKRKCYLFDDQKIVLESANDICSGVNYIHIDNMDPAKQLNISLIKRLIK